MAEKSSKHGLSGSWRGHYTYERSNRSYGFEAVFLENNGAVDGNILDDGRLGEANVIGTFGYPKVEFTKSYYRNGFQPVKYQGVMSEDGNSITGTWYISNSQFGTRGTWVVKRYTDAKELDIKELESKDLDSKDLATKEQLVETQRGPRR